MESGLKLKMAAYNMAVAISMGALGAHYVKSRVPPNMFDAFKTASIYHLIVGLGLFIILRLSTSQNHRRFLSPFFLLFLGIILFSGSLYAIVLFSMLGLSGINNFIGPLTPIGGVLMIFSWIKLAMDIK